MGRKTILIDDYDGSELPDDASALTVSVGTSFYRLYLSEKNRAALDKAIEPFLKNAETVPSTAAPRGNKGGASSADKEKMKKVREWAQATGFKFTDSKGEEKTLGDRGRIPDDVVAAYDKAN